jgi:hypothetical protein
MCVLPLQQSLDGVDATENRIKNRTTEKKINLPQKRNENETNTQKKLGHYSDVRFGRPPSFEVQIDLRPFQSSVHFFSSNLSLFSLPPPLSFPVLFSFYVPNSCAALVYVCNCVREGMNGFIE